MPAKGQIDLSIRDNQGNIISWKKRTNENRLRSNESARARRAANPEKIRIENRQHRERNPFGIGVCSANNRAKELGVLSTLTKEEWKQVVEQNSYCCHICGEKVSFEICSPLRLSIDHVIPFSKGGLNVKENVLPAHWSCNHSRHNMTLEEFDSWIQKVISYRGKDYGKSKESELVSQSP